MNIWILSPRCAPDITDDAAILCWHFARYQKRQGHHVTVMAISCAHDDVDNLGCPEWDNVPDTPYLNGTSYWAWHFAERILEAKKKGAGPDIIYALTDWGLAHVVLQEILTLNRHLRDIPVITLPAHPLLVEAKKNCLPRYRLDYWWAIEMERFTLRASAGVLSASEEMNRELDISQADLLSPSILFDTATRVVPDIHRLLMIGPIDPTSRLELWLSALSSLWEEGFPYPLEIIGTESRFSVTQRSYQTVLEQKFQTAVSRGWVKFLDLDPSKPVTADILSSSLLLHGTQIPVLSWPLMLATHLGTPLVALESARAQEVLGQNHTLVPPSSALIQKAVQKVTLEKPSVDSVLHRPVCVPEVSPIPTTVTRDMFPFIRPGHKSFTHSGTREDKNLSVVIPYYNLGSLILDALNSVFESQLIPDEVIVVDDGSNNEDSIEALRIVHKRYPIVRVIHTPNCGIVHARNLGSQTASGSFVAFLDGDDMYAPDYLGRCCQILETYRNVAFVGSWLHYFDENDSIWPAWTAEPPYVLYHNTIGSGIVIRRNALMDAGLNNSSMMYGWEDYESIVHLIAAGYRGVVIPEPLYHYRVRTNSRSRVHSHDTLWLYLYDVIRQLHQNIYAEHAETLVGLLNANGPQYRINSPLCPPDNFIATPFMPGMNHTDHL